MKIKYGSAEYYIEESKKQLDKAAEALKSVRHEIGGIQDLEPFPNFYGTTLRDFYKAGSYNPFSESNQSHIDRALENARKETADNLEAIRLIHEKNIPIIENNKETVKKIYDFMAAIGIPASYTVYELPSPRHRNKAYIPKRAGFALDCERVIKTTDFYDSKKKSAEGNLKRIEEQYNKFNLAIKKANEEKEKEQKQKETIKELARFQVKYNTEGEWDDILDKILDKNKYLRLGHWLLKNREDWNDGSDYAEVGLNHFVVETKEDQDIYKEINGLIENWCGDGRCFRDCEYNYDFLFGKVEDKTLLEDYNKVYSKVYY